MVSLKARKRSIGVIALVIALTIAASFVAVRQNASTVHPPYSERLQVLKQDMGESVAYPGARNSYESEIATCTPTNDASPSVMQTFYTSDERSAVISWIKNLMSEKKWSLLYEAPDGGSTRLIYEKSYGRWKSKAYLDVSGSYNQLTFFAYDKKACGISLGIPANK